MNGKTLDSIEIRTANPLANLQTIDPQKHAIVEEMEKLKRAREVAVPTDDSKVRLVLRAYHEPITLFGEGSYERRERLKLFLAERGESSVPSEILQEALGATAEEEMEISEEEDTEEFFTRGSQELLQARRWLANYSLPRSGHRIAWQQQEQQVPLADAKNRRKVVYQTMKQVGLYGTQVCGERPLSACAVAPNAKVLATGCFGGSIKLWSLPDCQAVRTYKGHRDRTTKISWHPQADPQQSSSAAVSLFVSGSNDGSIYLWNSASDEPIQALEGHQQRAAPFFHPSGRFIGTASFDSTWRLWDAETAAEILLQEGHSREVLTLAFQNDGALVASGGMDGFGRIWDLRTGRSIMLLEGHVQSILSMDFSPSGYEVVTASADNSFRIHDLRRLKSSVHVVPAHTNLVSAIKFRYQRDCGVNNGLLGSYYGDFMVSGSFDGSAKIWGVGDWKLLRNLAGHQNKIMDLDITSDGRYIITASYDRSVKVWTKDEFAL